ncbi:MAG: signal recognition particle protein [Phycisphaerales bacterium]|jgi:signal recognition particle subunit SRP54|nr:signal recognition particle protein [Phycisphaerales bacterium]
MFNRLTESFQGMYRRLSGSGSISEGNVREAMQDVRTALLEADVHYDVVQRFCDTVLEDAIGQDVVKSVKPGEQMVAIVHDRLVELLGGDPEEARKGPKLSTGDAIMRMTPGPTIVMMCGLQGSGKTTTCGKLAAYLKKRGRSVMLAAADLQRPAAVEQLETVATGVRDHAPGSAKVLFYSEPDKCAEYGKAVGVAVGVCQRALAAARREGVDTLILDTAGRLHVSDELMGELAQVNATLAPQHIFLVVDAMTGQDAVNSAKAFHQRLEVDGVILTKLDSDTRGGAAISVREVTGAPIKFLGVGEKFDALEEFHADRMAQRILGMGDVVSLVEKAQEAVSEEEAKRLEEKLARGEMTMDDFLKQLKTLRRMGPLKQLLGLLPGVGGMLKDVHVDDNQLDSVEAIINSMTRKEREKPELLNISRKKRVARGSGQPVDAVNQLTKQFGMMNRLAKEMSSMSAASKVKAVKEMGAAGGMGAMVPGLKGMPGLGGKGSTATSAGRFKKRKKR